MQKNRKKCEKSSIISKIDPPQGSSKYTVIRAGNSISPMDPRMKRGQKCSPRGAKRPVLKSVRFWSKNSVFLQIFANFFKFLSSCLILHHLTLYNAFKMLLQHWQWSLQCIHRSLWHSFDHSWALLGDPPGGLFFLDLPWETPWAGIWQVQS